MISICIRLNGYLIGIQKKGTKRTFIRLISINSVVQLGDATQSCALLSAILSYGLELKLIKKLNIIEPTKR